MTNRNKVIYIVGAISNDENYKEKFDKVERKLRDKGYEKIINPTCLPANLPYERYAPISLGFVQACDMLVVIEDWGASTGAIAEVSYARMSKKEILFLSD